MKAGPLLKKIIFSSWFMAIVPAFVVMLLLPSVNSRYRLEIQPVGNTSGQTMYADLNNDSVSEFIMEGKGIPYFHLLVMGSDSLIYDQWNLQDQIDLNMSHFFIGNYDHDRFSEIYVFTHKDDSLFLNINEFFESGGMKKERIFITKIGYLKGEVTSTINPAGFYDENQDGRDELYFSINTGFGLKPRSLYFYDIVNNVLKCSSFTGSICNSPAMVDVDGDNKPEIFGKFSGSGNQKSEVPFTDWSTWLMVFNEKLGFKFDPVEFPGYPSLLETVPYKTGDFSGFVLTNYIGSADTTIPESSVLLYTNDGRFVKSRKYRDIGFNLNAQLIVRRDDNNDRIFLLADNIYELDRNLNVVNTIKLDFKRYYRTFHTDVGEYLSDGYLLYSPEEEKLEAYNSRFSKLCEAKFNNQEEVWLFSTKLSGKNQKKLFLWTGSQSYFISLISNRLYYLGFLYYPLTYFAFVILIILTKKITTHQVIQRENLKQRLITLQLQGIKSQLDPHFTFNTLNSVASLIYHEDRQAAYDYMNKFTMLLRGMLNDAERIYRTLGEELEFVTTYLDLEKLRFGGKFNYEIIIGEGVTRKEQVPKLVLQTFAENSIKHGIMPCPSEGNIIISAVREANWLKLSIEDNGVGRKKAAGHSSSTGKGLKLTNEFYDILNQVNKRSITLKITDLFDKEGKASGTRVDVSVPVD
jgi:hypothetical protein